MQMKLLTSNGVAREITEVKNNEKVIRTIVDDDNNILDLAGRYYISTQAPTYFFENRHGWGNGEYMTILDGEKKLLTELNAMFNFNPKYFECAFNNFNKKANEVNYSKILKYCESQIKSESGYNSMIFYSKIWGVGKTHMLNAIANYWYTNPCARIIAKSDNISMIYSGASYQMIREEDLILRIRATYNPSSKESETDIYKELDKWDILAIDDVGKYTPSNMDFYHRVMFQIIDSRYNSNKGVILSTNLQMDELANFMGGAIADRLNEMSRGYQLEFKGNSHRGVVNE